MLKYSSLFQNDNMHNSMCTDIFFHLHVRLCATQVSGAHRGQKMASDTLRLESQMIVVTLWVLWRSTPVLLTSKPSFQPLIYIYIYILNWILATNSEGNHFPKPSRNFAVIYTWHSKVLKSFLRNLQSDEVRKRCLLYILLTLKRKARTVLKNNEEKLCLP